jgi:hypothetical protein
LLFIVLSHGDKVVKFAVAMPEEPDL